MTSRDIAYDIIQRTLLKRKYTPENDDDVPSKSFKTFFQQSVTPGFSYTAGAEHALAKVTCIFAVCVAAAAKSIVKKKNQKRIFGNDILTAVNALKLERVVRKINDQLPEYLEAFPNENGEASSHTSSQSDATTVTSSRVFDEVITIDSDSEDDIIPDNSEDEDADSENSDSVEFDMSASDNEKCDESEDSDSSVEICETGTVNDKNQHMAASTGTDDIFLNSLGTNTNALHNPQNNQTSFSNLEDPDKKANENQTIEVNRLENITSENDNLKENSEVVSETNVEKSDGDRKNTHEDISAGVLEDIALITGTSDIIVNRDINGATSEDKDNTDQVSIGDCPTNENSAASNENLLKEINHCKENIEEKIESSDKITETTDSDHVVPVDHSTIPSENPDDETKAIVHETESTN